MESMIWLQILAETVVYVGSLCTNILRKGMNPLLLVLSQLSTVSTKFSSLACHNSSLWSLPFTQRFFPDIGTICNLIGSVWSLLKDETCTAKHLFLAKRKGPMKISKIRGTTNSNNNNQFNHFYLDKPILVKIFLRLCCHPLQLPTPKENFLYLPFIYIWIVDLNL